MNEQKRTNDNHANQLSNVEGSLSTMKFEITNMCALMKNLETQIG